MLLPASPAAPVIEHLSEVADGDDDAVLAVLDQLETLMASPQLSLEGEGASAPAAGSSTDRSQSGATAGGLAAVSDAVLVDVIARLEGLRSRIAAAQQRAQHVFFAHQIAHQTHIGVPRRDRGRGIADQIALARHITPTQASRELALGRVVLETLPETTELLETGQISERAALDVAKAVLVLDDEDRAIIDHDLASSLPAMTPARAGYAARAAADRQDPAAAVRRIAAAEKDRHVSIRPAPDAMVRLSALLPVAAGVSVYASLDRGAKAQRSDGKAGSRGQLMADLLVQRVTGSEPGALPVEIHLLMTDRALLAHGEDTAFIDGCPIPADVARHLALAPSAVAPPVPAAPGDQAEAPPPGPPPGAAELASAQRWVRRLFTDPVTGELTDLDGRKRLFTDAARRFILARDRSCRTPWCDAKIHDIDHAHRHADGGATTVDNGIGVCQRFNLATEIPGWRKQIITSGADGGVASVPTSPSASPSPDLGPGPGPGPGPDLGPSLGSGPGPGPGRGRRGPGGDVETGAVLRITTPTGHTYDSPTPRLRPREPAPLDVNVDVDQDEETTGPQDSS